MTSLQNAREFHPRAPGNVHAIALEMVPKNVRGSVLDAAAGDRALSARLAELGFGVVSADVSFSDVPLPPNCVETDFNRRLPFEDRAFDGIVSVETIEHLENPWFFMRELSRILRPGGFLILSTPNVSSMFSRTLNVLTGRLLWFQPRDLRPLGHITPIHLHLLMEMAQRTGLSYEERRYSRGRVPLLNVTLPTGSRLLGECVVVRFQKDG